MPFSITRRSFLVSAGALAITTTFRPRALAGLVREPLYPSMDLSYFARPVTPAPFKLEFGCAAITWGGDDLQAIKEISEIGFPGIQLRANVLKDYGSRPAALRDLLHQYGLEMV